MKKQSFFWSVEAMMCALVCVFMLAGCEQPQPAPPLPKLAAPVIGFQDKAGNAYEHGLPYIIVSLAEDMEYPEGTTIELAVTVEGGIPEFKQVKNGTATPYGDGDGRKVVTVVARTVCEGYESGTTTQALTPVYQEGDAITYSSVYAEWEGVGYEWKLINTLDYLDDDTGFICFGIPIESSHEAQMVKVGTYLCKLGGYSILKLSMMDKGVYDGVHGFYILEIDSNGLQRKTLEDSNLNYGSSPIYYLIVRPL